MGPSASAGRNMKALMVAAAVLLGASAAQADLSQFKAFPNPVRPGRGQAAVTFAGLNGGTIEIYNANGRLVFETQVPAGSPTFLWNLLNNEGDRVASGVYLYRVTADGDERTGKLGVIR